MQALTLLVSLFGSVLVLVLQPAKAFAVYIAVLLFYPTFLSVQLGTLDFKAGRIVAAVLLLRCLFNPAIKKNFVLNKLDMWVIFACIVPIIVWPIGSHIPILRELESWSGELMDSLFAYLVARLCINNRSALVTAAKWIGIVLVPLALLGVVESSTSWQPYRAFQQYCPWDPEGVNIVARFGLYRAMGAFGHSIRFGTVFALFLPLIYSLRHERSYWRQLAYFLSLITVIGALSSMSSGPWMMIIIIIGCLALEHFKYLVKPLIIFVIFSCFIVNIISNRSFYDVLVRFTNPVGGAGWHRSRLIHLAIDHFNEWWIAGYGGRDPGWGPLLGSEWTDITNQYVMAAVQNGMLGVLALCGILATAVYMLVHQHKATKDPVLRSLYWALGSTMVMTAISFNACQFSAQTGSVYYSILGIIGSCPNFIWRSQIRIKT